MPTVLVASDKFKGSLTAAEVADAVAAGIRRARPDARVESVPVADGGERGRQCPVGGLGALLGPLFGVIFTDYFLLRKQKVTIEELYLDDPRSRYYYRGGWNPKALIAGGVAAVFSLFVALYKPWADWSAFSWFVGVVIAAVVYVLISARDFRQPELARATAEQESQA